MGRQEEQMEGVRGSAERNFLWPQAQTDPSELCHRLSWGPTHLSHASQEPW